MTNNLVPKWARKPQNWSFAGHRLKWSLGPGRSNFGVSQPISGPNFGPIEPTPTHPNLSTPPHPTPEHTPTGEHIFGRSSVSPKFRRWLIFVGGPCPWAFWNSWLRTRSSGPWLPKRDPGPSFFGLFLLPFGVKYEGLGLRFSSFWACGWPRFALERQIHWFSARMGRFEERCGYFSSFR